MIFNGNSGSAGIINGNAASGRVYRQQKLRFPDPRTEGWYFTFANANQGITNDLSNLSVANDKFIIDWLWKSPTAYQIVGIDDSTDLADWMALALPNTVY